LLHCDLGAGLQLQSYSGLLLQEPKGVVGELSQGFEIPLYIVTLCLACRAEAAAALDMLMLQCCPAASVAVNAATLISVAAAVFVNLSVHAARLVQVVRPLWHADALLQGLEHR
jgi:hypothetical protein